MIYRIELSNHKDLPGFGYKEIRVVPHKEQNIKKVIIETNLGFPRWVYRDEFLIPLGHDLIELKVYGDIKATFTIRIEFYEDYSSSSFLKDECHSWTYKMFDGSPSRLYGIVKELIADHKRINPSMLQ